MTVRELLDAIVFLSMQGPPLIESGSIPSRELLHEFWTLSRARQRAWFAGIKTCENSSPLSRTQLDSIRTSTEGVLTDLFMSDPFVRVTCGILTAIGQQNQSPDLEPHARHILRNHQGVRREALKLLALGPHLSLEQVVRLTGLQKRIERWTDMLLAQLVHRYDLLDYAFDKERAQDFYEEQFDTGTPARREQLWQLFRMCLLTAFPAELDRTVSPLCLEFRGELTRNWLGWLPSTLFSDAGVPLSPWMQRCLRTSVDLTLASLPQSTR